MKSKLIPIAYTVGVIKPNLALKEDKVTGTPPSHARSASLTLRRNHGDARAKRFRNFPFETKDPDKRRDSQPLLRIPKPGVLP